ncbi:MAG: alcohol dehydrogenase catalytic domain-containing protein [Pseudomonadota bacterium]
MKAVYFKDGKAALVEVPQPTPAPGQALIKPILAGVCNTDVELLKGYQGFEGIPGHEFVGRVIEAPGRPDLSGKRVAADINIGCGSCPDCLAGDARHCPDRKALGIRNWDGVFAEYFILPVRNLHLVGEAVSDLEAVFAEPLAAVLEISQQVHLKADLRTAVLGDGKIGLLCALALGVFLPRIVLIGRHENKLALAASLGLETMPAAAGEDGSVPAGRRGRFDLVIEATGHPGGIGQALELVRPRGVVVVKTTSRRNSEINLSGLVVAEKTVIGSRCGNIGLALGFLERKIVNPVPLVERVFPLDEFVPALAMAGKSGTGKVLIEF